MPLPSQLIFDETGFNELVHYALKERVLESYKVPKFVVTDVTWDASKGSWIIDLDFAAEPSQAVSPTTPPNCLIQRKAL